MNIKRSVPAHLLVTHRQPEALASEAFRVLRTNLQFLQLDQPIRSLLMTSATPGEGKTTTVANLAVAFAQNGSRVCLVDADLRRPMVDKIFGTDNWTGLTTLLLDGSNMEKCFRETEVPGLTVLPSGPMPPNAAEMLGLARMTRLLTTLEERYDMVLVDAPPVLAVADAAVLAPKVGGVVMVVRSGHVAHQLAARAKLALEAVHAKVLGAVLEAATLEAGQGYYYTY